MKKLRSAGSHISLFGVIALVSVACASPVGTDSDEGTATSVAELTVEADPAQTTEGPAVGAFPIGPSALDSLRSPEFPAALVDVDAIISGGPPPDGIPPIDSPTFVDVIDNTSILPGEEAVVALEINGDARAYPVRALIWHEIVNDTVGDVPVSVTYCPLCNSAATYERTIDGNVTTFGTSGKLFASALVMYDRATESLWTHFDGTAVVGVLTGTKLAQHASPLLSWSEFIQTYPTGQVLDWEAAGFRRDYGRNPYSGYDTPDGDPFLFRGSLDDRAAAMQRVVGIDIAGVSAAYATDSIGGGASRATNISIGGEDLVILWTAGQASALEEGDLAAGRDVGSVAVFLAAHDGEVLKFESNGDLFVDDRTGSTWNIAGIAIDGSLAGERLTAVPHLDTFWFAWSTYKPGTTLVSG